MLVEKQLDQKFVPFLNDKNKTTLHESGLSFKAFQLNVTVHKVEETQAQILLIRPVNFQIMNASYKLASVGSGCVGETQRIWLTFQPQHPLAFLSLSACFGMDFVDRQEIFVLAEAKLQAVYICKDFWVIVWQHTSTSGL